MPTTHQNHNKSSLHVFRRKKMHHQPVKQVMMMNTRSSNSSSSSTASLKEETSVVVVENREKEEEEEDRKTEETEEAEEEEDEREEVERKINALKRIVPGGDSLGIDNLFDETAGYILTLQYQVKALRALTGFFEKLEKENTKFGG